MNNTINCHKPAMGNTRPIQLLLRRIAEEVGDSAEIDTETEIRRQNNPRIKRKVGRLPTFTPTPGKYQLRRARKQTVEEEDRLEENIEWHLHNHHHCCEDKHCCGEEEDNGEKVKYEQVYYDGAEGDYIIVADDSEEDTTDPFEAPPDYIDYPTDSDGLEEEDDYDESWWDTDKRERRLRRERKRNIEGNDW